MPLALRRLPRHGPRHSGFSNLDVESARHGGRGDKSGDEQHAQPASLGAAVVESELDSGERCRKQWFSLLLDASIALDHARVRRSPEKRPEASRGLWEGSDLDL